MLETRASLNYLLDGGRETCRGVRSACFEVLNLCAGVSRSESGYKEIWREPSYIGPEYETVRALAMNPSEGSLHISSNPESDCETPAYRLSTSKHAE